MDCKTSRFQIQHVVYANMEIDVDIKYRRGGYKFQDIVKQKLYGGSYVDAIRKACSEKYPKYRGVYFVDKASFKHELKAWASSCFIKADCWDSLHDNAGAGVETTKLNIQVIMPATPPALSDSEEED